MISNVAPTTRFKDFNTKCKIFFAVFDLKVLALRSITGMLKPQLDMRAYQVSNAHSLLNVTLEKKHSGCLSTVAPLQWVNPLPQIFIPLKV